MLIRDVYTFSFLYFSFVVFLLPFVYLLFSLSFFFSLSLLRPLLLCLLTGLPILTWEKQSTQTYLSITLFCRSCIVHSSPCFLPPSLPPFYPVSTSPTLPRSLFFFLFLFLFFLFFFFCYFFFFLFRVFFIFFFFFASPLTISMKYFLLSICSDFFVVKRLILYAYGLYFVIYISFMSLGYNVIHKFTKFGILVILLHVLCFLSLT